MWCNELVMPPMQPQGWSPDGSMFMFTTWERKGIVIISGQNGCILADMPQLVPHLPHSFSPDGKM